MGDLEDIKDKISKAMASQGTYTPDLDLCIELCAGSYMAFRIALSDISKSRMKSYVKERPTVVVRMSGFKVSVLGEVASPGVYPVVNEQINVLEALAMAGDLTIYGVRDNVKLIREDKNGHKQFVTLNLNDADLLLSPYYQLQQNDILYVTPNKTKAQSADIGTSTTMWISGFSILVSIASLLVNILR